MNDYPADDSFKDVGDMLLNDYAEASTELDGDVGKWIGRVAWDVSRRHMLLSDAIVKHRKTWRAKLGLPQLA